MGAILDGLQRSRSCVTCRCKVSLHSGQIQGKGGKVFCITVDGPGAQAPGTALITAAKMQIGQPDIRIEPATERQIWEQNVQQHSVGLSRCVIQLELFAAQ